MSGHQYNKDHIQFVPSQVQQSHSDNMIGDLVNRLMTEIEIHVEEIDHDIELLLSCSNEI